MGVSVIPCYTWAFEVLLGPTPIVGRITHQGIQQLGVPAPPPGITALALQQLYHLDRSLSGYCDQLINVLCGEEYCRCASDLQCDDLVWLINYLDMVCCHVALPNSPLKPV